MTLYIDIESRIKDVQNQFNEVYPFLKIKFFKDSSNKKKTSQKDREINPDQKMKPVGELTSANKINISELRTVGQLEEDFKELFGLNAEVYRKAGNAWIQISLTNKWTLEQQNKEGEFISTHNN